MDPGIPVFGSKGSSVHVQEMIRALRRQKVEIRLITANAGGNDLSNRQNLVVHQLSAAPNSDPGARERAALAANSNVHEYLRRTGPYDFIYERFALWSFAGMEHARAAGIPGILEVNAPLIEEQARHRVLVHKALAERAARRSFRAASSILAVSAEVADWVSVYPEAAGRIHVISNGVDTERFHPDVPPAVDRKPDSFTIGFVGTLKPWHDLDTLVDAFQQLHDRYSDVRLLIVGDGPRRKHLKDTLAARHLLKSAQLIGAVNPSEVPAWLTSMDAALALYPDLDHFYFSPLKVYEYLAAGLPVVATNIGKLGGVITHGENGFLCPPGDTAAVVSALETLRKDRDLRERMGKSARALVSKAHTWDAVAKRVLELAAPNESSHGIAAEGAGC